MIAAVHNLKGGVGKTATVVNLGWRAARDGIRTLLWDLDPQGAASWHFRVEAELPGGARALTRRRGEIGAAIRGTDSPNLDLLPADFRLRRLDVLLADHERTRLGKVLEPVRADYDLVLIDCPPSIGRTIEAVFRLADVVLVPLIPTPLAVRTLDQVAEFCADKGLAPRLLPFFSLVDRRKSVHLETQLRVRERWPQCLDALIPSAVEVERMSIERQPVGVIAPGGPADRAYDALWTELRERLGV
jgi:chromosome partitioning protein